VPGLGVRMFGCRLLASKCIQDLLLQLGFLSFCDLQCVEHRISLSLG
jgi:hypothetical protein